MKSILVFVFSLGLLCCPMSSVASHILGGEMTVQHVSGNDFHVNVTLYRDIYGNALFDQTITVSVFQDNTDSLMSDLGFIMPLDSSTTAELGNWAFASGIELEVGFYNAIVTLPDDVNGYYLVWERCCRQDGLVNMQDSGDFGIVIHARISDPALENSSPQFEAYPFQGFFCTNLNNEFSFTAADVDGDSLVYSYSHPIHGTYATVVAPNPNLASPQTEWIELDYNGPDFSETNPIGGTTPLYLDSETGTIVGSPDFVGLFAVGVLVEEYRDGVKLGEIRRETVISAVICTEECPADLDGNGVISIQDFIEFNSAFGGTCTSCPADINEDGMVDVDDFLLLVTVYGLSCPW